jgi:hypothetical protein
MEDHDDEAHDEQWEWQDDQGESANVMTKLARH